MVRIRLEAIPKIYNVEGDEWLCVICDFCSRRCGVLLHRVNGVVVEIKADPNDPNGQAKLCDKAYAGAITLCDPHRLKPLAKSTNQDEGVSVPPLSGPPC